MAKLTKSNRMTDHQARRFSAVLLMVLSLVLAVASIR